MNAESARCVAVCLNTAIIVASVIMCIFDRNLCRDPKCRSRNGSCANGNVPNDKKLEQFYASIGRLQTLRLAYVTAGCTAIGAIAYFALEKKVTVTSFGSLAYLPATAIAVVGSATGWRVARFTSLISGDIANVRELLGHCAPSQCICARFGEAVVVWALTVLAVCGLLLMPGGE